MVALTWMSPATAASAPARMRASPAVGSGRVDVVRAQTTSLEHGVDKVNDSAVRILHMARTLRKVAVGK